jgi:hypothetical protein
MDEEKKVQAKHPGHVTPPEGSSHWETDNPAKRGGPRHPVNGLWTDKPITEVEEDIAMIDLRKAHRDQASNTFGLQKDGLGPEEKKVPEVTTLGQKAITHGTYQHVLALAGCAKKQTETEFDRIWQDLREMRKQARVMLETADKIERNLNNLKELAVLDY